MEIHQYSENSVTLILGNSIDPKINRKLVNLKDQIESLNLDGITELVMSYTNLIVYFDRKKISVKDLIERLENLDINEREDKGVKKRIVEIPVCYGGEYGPDLEIFEVEKGLTKDEVIDLHANKEYLVYMIGFMPGFPYLGGLDERLYKARLENPRTNIPAGSVGIGGQQTGMYPFDSPGGWNLLGRTPIMIYDPRRGDQAILYEPGDYIVFKPINEEEYFDIYKRSREGTYQATIREEEE